jgi:transcription elongation GreA/GreB family factor
LGWRGKIHRIWSTDWFYNPIREIERLQHFLQMRRQQSIQDAQDDQQKPERAAEPSSTQRDRGRVEPKPSITENQVVQVGDFVSFRFLDQPEKVHTKLIADSENNPRLNILNEHTPLAQALLGLSTAEVGAMSMDNTQTRQIEIINIQRGLSL